METGTIYIDQCVNTHKLKLNVNADFLPKSNPNQRDRRHYIPIGFTNKRRKASVGEQVKNPASQNP